MLVAHIFSTFIPSFPDIFLSILTIFGNIPELNFNTGVSISRTFSVHTFHIVGVQVSI
jgi:hypothetical protein